MTHLWTLFASSMEMLSCIRASIMVLPQMRRGELRYPCQPQRGRAKITLFLSRKKSFPPISHKAGELLAACRPAKAFPL